MISATTLLVTLVLATGSLAFAQRANSIRLPSNMVAGSGFAVPTVGSGKAILYIVGPAQAVRRDVQLGEPLSLPAGVLYSAGHYLTILIATNWTETGELDVVPAAQPESLSFLAKPSRLPVSLHDGISGAIYVFDTYRNLITAPMPATLELSNSSGMVQARSVTTRNGLAWTSMDSAAKEGTAKFVARIGGVSSTRIIQEVPGDPCAIKISARPDGGKLEVQTAPVRDCSGNPVPDGTIVTFTETLDDTQSTVDVPIKQGIARVDMPAYKGARISAASGVVAGNEIRWEGER
jgi:hypothetical protein